MAGLKNRKPLIKVTGIVVLNANGSMSAMGISECGLKLYMGTSGQMIQPVTLQKKRLDTIKSKNYKKE